MKYCFLLSFTPNPRMIRRISLVKTQFQVSLVCWERQKEDLWGSEQIAEIKQYVVSVRANNGNPLKRLLPTVRFADKAIHILKRLSPDIIHAENLDMLMIAAQYKKHYNAKVEIIYEIADINSIILDSQSGFVKRIAQSYFRAMDRKLSKRVALLICTSEKYYESYYSKFIEEERCIIVPNIPDAEPFRSYMRKTEGPFTIGYIGAIRYIDQAKMLLEAAQIIGVKVMFAGSELGSVIRELCENNPCAEYYGPYSYSSDIAKLYGRVDCVYSVYDNKQANVRIALPNKLFEAVLCELPILVSSNTYLSEIVRDWNVGIAVMPDSLDALCSALEQLKNNMEFYNSIVRSCKEHKQAVNSFEQNRKLLSAIMKIVSE